MKKSTVLKTLIIVISVVAALTAAFTAMFILREKKRKDDQELEHYLDNVIS